MPKAQKPTKQIYLKRFKEIAPYVSFSYSDRFLSSRRITHKQKVKITRYYKQVAFLKSLPHQIYRPKSEEKLRAAREYSGQTRGFDQMTVAFIPTGGKKVKVKYSKGKITVAERHVSTTDILFDQKDLFIDPIKHVKKKLKSTKAKGFNIMAGTREIPFGESRASLPGAIAKLMETYGQKYVLQGGKRRKNNHYVGNWLLGVRAHSFKKQASFNKYIFAKKKAIDQAKERRKKNAQKNSRDRLRNRPI